MCAHLILSRPVQAAAREAAGGRERGFCEVFGSGEGDAACGRAGQVGTGLNMACVAIGRNGPGYGLWGLMGLVEGGARAGKWADDFFFLKKSNQGPLTIALVFSPLSLYIYFYLYIYIYIPIK